MNIFLQFIETREKSDVERHVPQPPCRFYSQEIVLNCVISACADCWQAALAVLYCDAHGSSYPNTRSYNSAISACANESQWQLVLVLLEEILGNDGANAFIYSSAMSACEKASQWQRALGLFEQMTFQKVSANEFTYSSAMSACEKSEQWRISVQLMDSMYSSATRITDEVTFNATISASGKGHQWQQVW